MRFDMICEANGIEHRLTKPNHPWTNGQVERMNRTIKEATVKRFHYESHDQLRTHLADFMAAYNFARRLKTLSGLTPYEYIAKIWTSESDRFIVNPIHQVMDVSERRVCRVLGQHRSTQRKVPCGADDEEALTDDIVALARQYGRYGYRRVTALLHAAGWSVNHKRVERIWRREGLKVPQRQPKRGRLWLNDGSCIRLRPEYPGHIWAYDFVEARTHDGRKFRILTIRDCQEFCAGGHRMEWKGPSIWQSTRTFWTSFWLVVTRRSCLQRTVCSTS